MYQETKGINWKKVIQMGLIWGGIVVYVSVINMVAAFSERNVVQGWLTLGRILIFVPLIVGGYMIVYQNAVEKKPGLVLTAGAGAGFFAALPILLLIWIQTLLPSINQVFVNIAPRLTDILTYGTGVGTGSVLVLLTAVGMALIGSGFHLLPDRAQRTVSRAAIGTLLVGMFGELFVQILRPLLGNAGVRVLFTSGALNLGTALGVAALFGAQGWFRDQTTARYETFKGGLDTDQKKQFYIGQIVVGSLLMLILPFILGRFLSDVMVTIGIYIMMGLGLNIAIGLAGLLDLGYVTNYAVGGYVMAVLTATPPDGSGFGWPFWVVLPLCFLAAMCVGFMFGLPVLRMRGDYLAIATLGFGEIIRILAISEWLAPYIGGAQGMLYIPKPNFFGLELRDPQQLYYVVLAGCAFVLYISWRLNNSRTGRQWMAMREDEDVAEAMGINLVRTKLLAFTLSASAGGLAGGIFAVKLGTVFPTSFNIFVSINVLSLIIVGGMGSIPGIIVGAIFLVGLPELLREFVEYRLLIYGAVLVWMMLVRPEGLIPSATRRRELRGTDLPDDADGPDAQLGDANRNVVVATES